MCLSSILLPKKQQIPQIRLGGGNMPAVKFHHHSKQKHFFVFTVVYPRPRVPCCSSNIIPLWSRVTLLLRIVARQWLSHSLIYRHLEPLFLIFAQRPAFRYVVSDHIRHSRWWRGRDDRRSLTCRSTVTDLYAESIVHHYISAMAGVLGRTIVTTNLLLIPRPPLIF